MVHIGELHVEELLRIPMLTPVQTGASCKWLNDSQRFILEHFDTICNSPSQIYHFALPFCPSSSWIYDHYTAELPQEVRVVKGLPAGWGTCSRTVIFDYTPDSLTCWRDIVAVGLSTGEIITLDRITGIQTAILSGHTDHVKSLAFSPDGTSLVSGSYDKTIKLWDVQTGGVVKTFHGHTGWIYSVSISADWTTIASGSRDTTICLWDIQTEECHHFIEQQDEVYYVGFSPTDPQCLISVSGDKVWHWNMNAQQTNSAHTGSCVAFSLDGTQFVSCHKGDIVVQNSSSGGIVTKFHMTDSNIHRCCFSPDGRLIATAINHTVHVWDTTSSHPHPIKIFSGHTNYIASLIFSSPSSLISTSGDCSVKFWEIGTLQADPLVADPESTSLASAQIVFIALQAEDGIAISSDSDGVVKTWDISTGLCKASFQTPAKHYWWSDAQLVNGRLIYVWYKDEKIHIWDERGELLQAVDATVGSDVDEFRISGDGSNVFCLHWGSIQAWSTQTGIVSKVELEFCTPKRSLIVEEGSRVWVHSPESQPMGWDFGTPGSHPVQLFNSPLPLPNNAKLWDVDQYRVKDAVTGKLVLQLAGRFANPAESRWDGRYLVAGYMSGEVLILDFNRVHI